MQGKFAALFLFFTIVLSACSGGATESQLSDADAVSTIVAATVQANAAANQAATQAAPKTGSIAGNLSFPSERILPLNVVAYLEGSASWTLVTTEMDQGDYQIDGLAPGNYTVVAYVSDGDFGGGFTWAVPCGLSVECTDHSLIVVEVYAGQITSGVDPGDWYAEEGAFPPNPSKSAAAEEAEEEGFGSIAGTLSYPSEQIPAMQVTAFNLETGFWWYTLTVQNQSSYQLDDLPVGDYTVVAYPVGAMEGGGYTAAVPCGLTVACSDHGLLAVSVEADAVTSGIDPGDWYAGAGAFPPNPAP